MKSASCSTSVAAPVPELSAPSLLALLNLGSQLYVVVLGCLSQCSNHAAAGPFCCSAATNACIACNVANGCG
jgi:hypothetical protein